VPLVEELLREELVRLDELRQELAEHVDRIKEAARANEFIDTSLAERLASACSGLLDRVDGATPEASRRLVQVAVRYFIIDDDAEPDLESVCGLDDDTGVLNAVLRHLGHEDLIVSL
jgi:uncharacterized membrane protein YkvA (DUF1232 family)